MLWWGFRDLVLLFRVRFDLSLAWSWCDFCLVEVKSLWHLTTLRWFATLLRLILTLLHLLSDLAGWGVVRVGDILFCGDGGVLRDALGLGPMRTDVHFGTLGCGQRLPHVGDPLLSLFLWAGFTHTGSALLLS